MKKFLGIFLAMVMAISVLSLPVIAKPHATLDSNLKPVKDVIVEFEFNNSDYYWANYAGGTGTFYYTGGSNASTATDANISSDGFLSVNGEITMYLRNPADNGTGWAANASDYDVESNLLRDTYVTEFDFMLPAAPASNMNNFFCANSNSGQGTSNGPKLRLTSSRNINVEHGSGSLLTVTPSALKLNSWYTLKMVNNLKDQNYDLYLDGILIGDDLQYSDGKLEATVFNKPFAVNTTCSNGTVGNIYVDNLKIYKEVAGRTTFAADDFSGDGVDQTYSESSEIRNFAGLALDPRTGKQNGVKIDAANDRAEFAAGANLAIIPITAWPTVNTDADAIAGQKQLAVEFDFTPTAASVGDFYNIGDATGTHYGLILSANNGVITAKAGRAGDVTPSSANVGIDLASFEANETYRIKVYVDLDKKFTQNLTGNSTETNNKEHTRSGLADVYIDGVLVGAEIPLRYNCNSATNASYDITNLGKPFAANGGATATYYIDNLAVYADVRDKVLSGAINAVDEKVSAKSIELPSSTEDGYAITWVSNSDAIDISGNTATVTSTAANQSVTLTATVADTDNQLTVNGKINVIVPPDYEVYVKYANSEDNATGNLEEAVKLVNAEFRDNYNTSKDADIIAAVYDSANGNKLITCKVFKSAVSGTVNPIGIDLAEGYIVKIFLLSGDDTLVPVPFTHRFAY